jgi:nitroimidazol reductase NimA-like FMN-containing flavoprotein (pyridoxamine 5'-phosphate oxidase superfamily)
MSIQLWRAKHPAGERSTGPSALPFGPVERHGWVSEPEEDVMVVIDGRTGLEQLSVPACWALLAGSEMGRLGVVVDGGPEIYPVNFVVDGEHLAFRTAGGGKLRGLERSPAVCFEVDGVDLDERSGWSVLVKGRAEVVRDAETSRRLAASELRYWAPGEKAQWVRVAAREVTGRRIFRPAGPTGGQR